MKLFRRTPKAVGSWILVFALLVGLAVVSCSRTSTGHGNGGGGYKHPPQSWANQPGADLLWSVDRLKTAMAKRDDFILVDCRYSVADFDAGHIEKAIWIDWHEISNDPPIDFPPVGDVETFLGEDRGIRTDSKIVLYGDGLSDVEAPFRLFWMLEYYGCRDVHIVDGGFAAWVAAGYTVDNTPWDPTAIVPETFVAFVDSLGLAEADDVQLFLADPFFAGSVLIDVRDSAEFNGEFAGPYQDRAGRIPHASRFDWLETIDPATGLLVGVTDVIDLFENAGYDNQKEIIAYSTTGVESTALYFLSRVLGYNCRVYHGGMANWTDVDAPPLGTPGLLERSGPFFHRSVIAGDKRPHYAGDAVVLDGQVYLIGGFRWDESEQRLRLNRRFWRFDPTVSPVHEGTDATNWTMLNWHTGMPLYASSAVAVPDANAIYIFGGINSVGKVYDLILRVDIDPATQNAIGVTKLAETLAEPLAFGNAVYNDVDGLIYLFGGQTGLDASSASSNVYAYTPGAAPVAVASLPSARTRIGSAVVNGKIYCLGGEETDGTLLNEALEYDPGLDLWNPLSAMNSARLRAEGAVAFGRIYVCGGFSHDPVEGYGASKTVESYDPEDPSAGWRDEGAMTFGRFCNPVAAVNNRIYLFGGYDGLTPPLDNEIEYMNVLEFQPANEVQKTAMPAPQHGGAVATVNGKVYLFGGNERTALTDRVLEYDPMTDTYTDMDSYPAGPVGELSAVAIGAKAHLFGGNLGSDTTQASFAFDPTQPAGSQWTALADMPLGLYGAAAAAYNDANNNLGYGAGHDLVFVIGGMDRHGMYSDYTYIYDATNDSWDTAAFLLPSGRSHMAAATCMNDLILTGGIGAHDEPLSDTLMLVLDAATPTWNEIGAMPTPRYGHGAVMVDGRFYNIGGFVKAKAKYAGTGAIEFFDALKNRWTALEPLTTGRALPFVSAAPTATGMSLFLMGGFTGTTGGTYFDDTVELAP